ncbi:MAG: glycosyltransferase family 2 protein [Paracoccaceae bacterium]
MAGSRLIVTTMKNEGPFILEWIAYNLSVGFTDFLVYTNDCDDHTDDILVRLQELGIVRHEPNPMEGRRASPQRLALRRANTHPLKLAAEWVMAADVDEFLNIRVGARQVDDLIEAAEGAGAISLCWKLFGSAGRERYLRQFVTGQFTRAAGAAARHPQARGFKTLWRNDGAFGRFGVHRPKQLDPDRRAGLKWVDGGGQPMPEKFLDDRGWAAHRGFRHDLARLHHYAVRSLDSFLVKRDRGRTNHVQHDQGLLYWKRMNMNQESDESILPMIERARPVYGDLLSDGRLAELHEAACCWHEAKIAELRARPDWQDFIEDLMAEGGAERAETAA